MTAVKFIIILLNIL